MYTYLYLLNFTHVTDPIPRLKNKADDSQSDYWCSSCIRCPLVKLHKDI